MTHTPEPWNYDTPYTGTYIFREGLILAKVRELEGIDHIANASRIVACVNAMAGIADPQAFRDSVDKLTAYTKEVAEIIRQKEERIKELEARLDELGY